MKNSNQIETATFWLVAQCLNQPRHRVQSDSGTVKYELHLPEPKTKDSLCIVNLFSYQ
jgi:hypothetical protein